MVVAACGIFTCSMQDLVPWLRVNPGPLRWECSLSHWATREVLRNSWKQPSSLCCCCCSVAQASLTLCDPTDCSPLRLLCPGDFPGKNIGVGCHFLLQGIFLTQRSKLYLLQWQADSLPLEPPQKAPINYFFFKELGKEPPRVSHVVLVVKNLPANSGNKRHRFDP